MHEPCKINLALTEKAKTVTEPHLRATATTEDHVKLWFSTAIKDEADLVERKGANERLLELPGLRTYRKPPQQDDISSAEEQKTLPGSPH
jgi:hypothetical protein